eukprot:gene7947-193_t
MPVAPGLYILGRCQCGETSVDSHVAKHLLCVPYAGPSPRMPAWTPEETAKYERRLQKYVRLYTNARRRRFYRVTLRFFTPLVLLPTIFFYNYNNAMRHHMSKLQVTV